MSTLPLSKVKARSSELAEEVAATHERLQITKNGRDYVVLLAAQDIESIEATLESLSDRDAQVRMASAERDIERGDVLDEAAVRSFSGARHPSGPGLPRSWRMVTRSVPATDTATACPTDRAAI
jgi:antitoxin YefM